MATKVPNLPSNFCDCSSAFAFFFVCLLVSWEHVCFIPRFFKAGRAVFTVTGVVPSSVADVSHREHGREAGEL